MNRSISTYFRVILKATFSGTCMGSSFSDEGNASGFTDSKAQRKRFAEHSFYHSPSSDEGNACGFTDSKAQRERFAEHYDFSTTNTIIRDEETGFGYFGARYYDSELLTGWMSVDPMADKYPSLSPYTYCAWNPVKLVDPDGREWDPTTKNKFIDPSEKEIKARMELINRQRSISNQVDLYGDQYREYESILDELRMLGEDKDYVYKVNSKSFAHEGEVRYGGILEDGRTLIDINLDIKSNITTQAVFSHMGTLAHELKHAYQFYEKRLGFVLLDGKQVSSTDNQELEKQAFRRGDMFSLGLNPIVTNLGRMRYDYELDPETYTFQVGTPYASYLDRGYNKRDGYEYIFHK